MITYAAAERYLTGLIRPLLFRLVRLIWQPAFHGFEHLPAEGPLLIVANHVSYLDGLLISAGIKRPVRFIIHEPIYRLPIIHQVLKLGRAIPVLPTRESVEAMLQEVEAGLARGDVICIFPEGQLTYTGFLGRFKPGIEWIVQRCAVDVYPVALAGLWGSAFSRKYRKSKWWWKLLKVAKRQARIRLVCGPAIPPAEVKADRLQRDVLELKAQAEQL